MQYKDAAYQILKQAGKPLPYKEICDRAVAEGLVTPTGQTPEATMASLLYTDTQREDSRFERAGRGIFGLKEKRPGGVVEQIEAANMETREKLRALLAEIEPRNFELLVGSLLRAMGLDEDSIDVTRYSKDRGIDVRGTMKAYGLTDVKVAVQVKRWKGNISSETVQKLRGAINPSQEHGIIITNSDFTKAAIQEASVAGVGQITLINGETLIELLLRNQVGVSWEQHRVYSVDEEYWENVLGIARGDNGGDSGAENPPGTGGEDAGSTGIFPLKIRGHYKGQEHWAEMLDIQGKVRFNGVEYGTPTTAAHLTMPERKSVDGWRFWRYFDEKTGAWKEISELRPAKEHST